MKQSDIIYYASSEPSPLFAQMLRENSTRSLEWLRAADYMPDAGERRYCLKRVLLLDPDDSTARTLLVALEQSQPQVARYEYHPILLPSFRYWFQFLLKMQFAFGQKSG